MRVMVPSPELLSGRFEVAVIRGRLMMAFGSAEIREETVTGGKAQGARGKAEGLRAWGVGLGGLARGA